MTSTPTPGMTVDVATSIAISWAQRGVPVFPIAVAWNTGKKATDKRPLTGLGGHKNGSTDPDQIRSIFTDGSTRLRSGEVLGVGGWPGPAGYVVLDPDVKGGKDGVTYLDLVMGITRKVFIVDTASGGQHHWFKKRQPGAHIDNVNTWEDHGVDVRADNGWVVLPPTATPWGKWAERADEGAVAFADTPMVPEALWQQLVDGSKATAGNGSGSWSRYRPEVHDPQLHPTTVDMVALLKRIWGLEDTHFVFKNRIDGEPWLEVTRPGKKGGCSASLGYIGPDRLHVWSSEWPDLAPGPHSYWDIKAKDTGGDPPKTPNTGAEGGSGGFGGVDPHYFMAPAPGAGLPPEARNVLAGQIADEVESAWGVPPMLTFAAAVGVAASTTRGKVTAVLPTGASFPTALYQAALASPGMLKSPVLSLLSRPALDLQTQWAKGAAPGVAIGKAKIDALKAAVKSKTNDLATAYSKNTDPDQVAIELDHLTRQLADLEDSTGDDMGLGVLVAGADLTYEALIRRAADNGGKVALMSAEGGLMENLAGRYSEGAARTEFLNSAYDGEPYSGERISDASRVIANPWANLLLVVQPDVLDSMLASDHMRRRGFLQRFWLYNIPTNGYRTRHDLPTIDVLIQEEWKSSLERIWRAATTSVGPIEIMCDSGGDPLRQVETDVIKPAFHTAQTSGNHLLAGWLAKAAMTSVRLAAVLELMQRNNLLDGLQIGQDAAEAAAAITIAAADHARHLFSEGHTAVERSPRYRVLTWILNRNDPPKTPKTPETGGGGEGSGGFGGIGGVEVTTRDVWQRFRDQKWCQRTDDAKAVLTDLAALGWISGPVERTGEHGGRPSEVWRPHPEAHDHFAAMTGGTP